MTALMVASDLGHEKLIELFLKQPGIDVNLKDKRGATAWNLASYSIRQQFPKLNPNA
jgi:ankyrin repeat protein